MTFTQYLGFLCRRGRAPSFWACLEHEAWPESATRLEAFEAFLRRHLRDAQAEVIPELRARWGEWSGDHRDMALARWRDYALHLRDCELVQSGLCPRAQDLLALALEESRFIDLAHDLRDLVPCEDSDQAEARRRVEWLTDQVLDWPDVEAFLRRHTVPSSPKP
jgi:hypothetical protein